MIPPGAALDSSKIDQIRQSDKKYEPSDCRKGLGNNMSSFSEGWASLQSQNLERSIPLLMLDDGKELNQCRTGEIIPPLVSDDIFDYGKSIKSWYSLSDIDGDCIQAHPTLEQKFWNGKCVNNFRTSRYCNAAKYSDKALSPTYDDFPSPKCTKSYPLSWRSLCCTWYSIKRNTTVDQQRHYESYGPWEVFRQSRHNNGKPMKKYRILFQHIVEKMSQVPINVIEYGAGIAPGSYFLAKNQLKIRNALLVDLASDHLYFGAWRLRSLLQKNLFEQNITFEEVRALEADGDTLPDIEESKMKFNIAIVLTVFEHVPNPLELSQKIIKSLARPAIAMIDFCSETHLAKIQNKMFGSPNLGSSAILRNDTLTLFHTDCKEIGEEYVDPQYILKHISGFHMSGEKVCAPMFFYCE